ncbi:hypothetical protein ACWGJ2_36225 [Streptomyces sp. NPDC054796]
MGHIGPDSTQKGILRAAVEKNRSYSVLAAQYGGEDAMHSVDHLHIASVDEYGRKQAFGFRQANDMFLILPLGARRFPQVQRRYRDGRDLLRELEMVFFRPFRCAGVRFLDGRGRPVDGVGLLQ